MRRYQQGFTLMEAIVALVLIATMGMALFSWVNSNIVSLQRVQASNDQDTATTNALEYLHHVNPMVTPQGQVILGTYTMRWRAEPIVEPRDGANYPTGISLYQLSLFLTEVEFQREDGSDWFSFQVQQVGYKKVREIRPPF